MFAQMTRQHLEKDKASLQERPEADASQLPDKPASSSSAASEGWEHISVADDFSISVVGSEAKIHYEDKLVARAVLSRGDIELTLEPSLQGRRHFPMDGFMQAYQKAQQLLRSS